MQEPSAAGRLESCWRSWRQRARKPRQGER